MILVPYQIKVYNNPIMALETLGKIFGSLPRVKIMRLFLLNPEQSYDVLDVSTRSRVARPTARRELSALQSAGMIKAKSFSKEIPATPRKKARTKKVNGWCLTPGFVYSDHLKNLLIDAEFLRPDDLVQRFKRIGKIKLFLVSGVFIGDDDSRVDFLLVGDTIKKGALDNLIKALEAEVGKELSYAVFETQDFLYRLSMYDKLIRDILDYPHERLIESAQLSTQSLANK
jgi:hypothetical protein